MSGVLEVAATGLEGPGKSAFILLVGSSGFRPRGLYPIFCSADKVHDNLLEVKVNEMIGFSLIGLIIYLYKSKGHGVSWDWFLRVGFFVSWPFRELALL